MPAELELCQTISHFPSPHWYLSTPCEKWISTTVPDIAGWADDIHLKHRCSLTPTISYQADYTFYTNGSASGVTRNGGAAAVVTRGSPIQPEVVTTIKIKVRTFTSSYKEEAATMESALSWTFTNANHLSITIWFTIFTQIVNQIPVHLQFAIPLTPSPHSSSFNGSLAILPFKVTN